VIARNSSRKVAFCALMSFELVAAEARPSWRVMFTKGSCGLCDRISVQLQKLRRKHGFELEELAPSIGGTCPLLSAKREGYPLRVYPDKLDNESDIEKWIIGLVK
jgi:hypothetical protein